MFREKIRKTIYERELKVDKVAEAIGVNQAKLVCLSKRCKKSEPQTFG